MTRLARVGPLIAARGRYPEGCHGHPKSFGLIVVKQAYAQGAHGQRQREVPVLTLATRTTFAPAGNFSIRKLKSILLIVDRRPTPALLPILRSQQQGEILALLLGDPDLELSLTEIAARTGAPHASVHREIERAEQAGLVVTRKLGNTRLVRANTASPYYTGLTEVLTRAFGVPAVVAEALLPVNGIAAAYIYGSWAARREGRTGQRPVGDIDVLILGEPDRDQLYAALSDAEERLGRPVQATIRDADWLDTGSGAFHDTVTSRPLLRLPSNTAS